MILEVESPFQLIDEVHGVTLEPRNGSLGCFAESVLLCKEHQ